MTAEGCRPELPALPIVDAHIHFWDMARLSYPWLSDAPSLPARADAMLFDQATNRLPGDVMVGGLVVVQAECDPDQADSEVFWILTQRALGAPIAGVVAFAPLEDAGATDVLDRYAGLGIVKGIRRNIQDEAPGFWRRLTPGVRSLADYGLSFDLCVREHQLSEAIELVDAAPDTRFVLDHLGKPSVGSPHWADWAGTITDLASRPNVHCKLSGLGTEAPPNWTLADVAPYIRHAVEEFGIHRVMFGSDWPVCAAAGSYRGWLETVASLVTSHQDRVFAHNATAFYRLDQG
ncbi:MAG: amidohydrolase family protein [bacterium]|nr:amidohydrolase family protein [Acidimicrobiia bacterium]MCY4649290.1 amidohydrolase family protein [bacterium]